MEASSIKKEMFQYFFFSLPIFIVFSLDIKVSFIYFPLLSGILCIVFFIYLNLIYFIDLKIRIPLLGAFIFLLVSNTILIYELILGSSINPITYNYLLVAGMLFYWVFILEFEGKNQENFQALKDNFKLLTLFLLKTSFIIVALVIGLHFLNQQATEVKYPYERSIIIHSILCIIILTVIFIIIHSTKILIKLKKEAKSDSRA